MKLEINADQSIFVEQYKGQNVLGDVVPSLDVSVSEMHSVGITDHPLGQQSTILVCPLRLSDGSLRSKMDYEPAFHPNAHYLIRITGPSMKNDKYHQFDKNGNYLG